MLTVVAYDIVDDRNRLKVAETLKAFGERVQYSVFECHLETEELETLRHRLLRWLDEESDSVRIYRLCGSCEPGVEVIGCGGVTNDPEVYIL